MSSATKAIALSTAPVLSGILPEKYSQIQNHLANINSQNGLPIEFFSRA
ncbi:MAG: hypothetical protein QNJ72_06645 [Pleurocapsa sp. MO_226.B13]|nr:hypothetical protein [Pleurocapsa sp. MO_226.B13]